MKKLLCVFQVSRKTTYRFFVVHRIPQVQILDEQMISEDERFRAEIYYTDTVRKTSIIDRSILI